MTLGNWSMTQEERVQFWECLYFLSPSTVFFLFVGVNVYQNGGSQRKLVPMWKKLRKHIDLPDPTPLLHIWVARNELHTRMNK